MPNWEESSDQHDSNAHSSNYNNHEDLSDDGDEASQDGEDDDEPDPFINLLDKNEPTGSSAPSTNQPSAQNELKRKNSTFNEQMSELHRELAQVRQLVGQESKQFQRSLSKLQADYSNKLNAFQQQESKF